MIKMIKKICYILVIVSLLAFNIPKNLFPKIEKEVKESLNILTFSLVEVKIPSELNLNLPLKISSESFFSIENKQQLKGYLYYGQAKGKSAFFDFIVIFDKDLIISKIKILTYRESYGGEIGSMRWLKQFIGLSPKSSALYKNNIAAISGATISASALTIEVNKLLKSIDILIQNHLLI